MDILIVDDHALVRDGLALVLESLDERVVVHQADSIAATRAFVAAGGTLDLALIDVTLPDGDGLDLVAALLRRWPEAAIVALSGVEDPLAAQRALAAGARAFVPKSSPTPILLQVLRLVLAGGTYTPPASLTASPLARESGQTSLTSRQLVILEQLAAGHANKQIAHRLGITEATVKGHVSAIFRALGVSNRTQAVRTAQRLGFVD